MADHLGTSRSKPISPISGLPTNSDSWSRCQEFGLRASGKPVKAVLSSEKFRIVIKQHESVRHLVLPELELLHDQIADTNFMVAYANVCGVALDPWTIGLFLLEVGPQTSELGSGKIFTNPFHL